MEFELLDFYGNSCGPCKMITPRVEKFAEEKNIKLTKIEVYENMEDAQKYEISSVPTLVLLKNGQQVFRANGVVSINKLEQDWEFLSKTNQEIANEINAGGILEASVV